MLRFAQSDRLPYNGPDLNLQTEINVRGKIIARTIITVLAGIALAGMIILAVGPRIFLPPLPPPPVIDAPRGDLPAGVVAFEERIPADSGPLPVGAGFLLELPNGDVIGVTTAHSVGLGNFPPIEFVTVNGGTTVATFSQLYAPLGIPITGTILTHDYILMTPDSPLDPAIVLQPDPRGAPLPGERVLLYSGRGDPSVQPGTVESVGPDGVWVRMDRLFNPGGLSGSPVISQHTGRVVGMIVAASPRIGAIVIGVNPIGVIVSKATSK